MTVFRVVEQHDGRYITVALHSNNSAYLSRGETLIPYEKDVRSFTRCYEAISDFVLDTGMYCDGDVIIQHIRYAPSA